jgi:hypothetical protein
MFKCGDKCTGILAAEARLVREKVCYATAIKEKDTRSAESAAQKVKTTTAYIALMNEWPSAVSIAIGPAMLINDIKQPDKRATIMRQVQQVQETGINPITGDSIGLCGVTGAIIKYLIAKYDGKPFVQEKRFKLNKSNVAAIKYAIVCSRENPKAVKFLQSLLKT